jgi:pyruvate,water dikinase
MEDRLTRFTRQHLPQLTAEGKPLADGVQVLLRALPGTTSEPAAPAVLSADWYWPIDTSAPAPDPEDSSTARHERFVQQREAAEERCLQALPPNRRRRFSELLDVTRRYGMIRETQARDLTIGWPLLRACAQKIGQDLAATGHLESIEQVFFLIRDDLDHPNDRTAIAREHQSRWQEQRKLPAPLTLGNAPRLIGDPVAQAVQRARGLQPIPDNAIIGQPASAGRATGAIRLIIDPGDFTTFQPGEILLTRATAPAWTPLFAIAAAVITDGGARAAHASIVAREYGIPAVVGTGDATHRLRTGQWVTVDGTTGSITLARPHPAEPSVGT